MKITRPMRSLLLMFGIVMSANVYADTTIALLPRLPEAQMRAMFEPLAAYLSKETGEKVTLVVPSDFAAFKKTVESGKVDYAFANPLVYVQLKKSGSAQEPLGIASEKEGGTEFRGIIIARKDSAVSNVAQLKGKKLIFVDQDSAGGYIVQLLTLQNAGLQKDKDYTILPFAKKHSEVVKAVLEGKADAGGIRLGDLEKIKGLDTSNIKIIATSEAIPNWPVFSTKNAPASKVIKFKTALLNLSPNGSNSGAILGEAGITGFVPVQDNQYDAMRKAGKIADAY